MSGGLRATRLHVPRLDCPAEERLVAAALGRLPGVRRWEADLAGHAVTAWHAGPVEPLLEALAGAGLPARILESREAATEPVAPPPSDPAAEARTLRLLMALNATLFVVEAAAGWLADSTGLLADSLDMLADAMVYGMALGAVGAGATRQLRVARAAGLAQLLLAAGALAEVARRAVAGSSPEPPAMMGVALLALATNVTCLVALSRHRHGGAHLRASWIFSASDVLANAGVILAGALVALTGSRWPDLVVGAAIGLLVLRGALAILRLR